MLVYGRGNNRLLMIIILSGLRQCGDTICYDYGLIASHSSCGNVTRRFFVERVLLILVCSGEAIN